MDNPNNYPVDAFPEALYNAIHAVHEDTQMPIEMIASTLLAASALALQPLIEIMSPFDNTKSEPCSLYFLTLAKSGEGKSPLRELIMQPFDDFIAEMHTEYEQLLEKYKQDFSIWSLREKALNRTFQKAAQNGNNAEVEEFLLREHLSNKPIKPKCFEMFYDDATPEGIIQGLQEHPYAGIFADEAITFFTGHLKNKLGLLNKIWKNEPISLSRKKEGTVRLNANLTILLMVQPDIFNNYLETNGKHAISSGFLSRFLFTNTISTVEYRKINLNQEKSQQALSYLFDFFKDFFAKQKQYFYDSSLPKKNLQLSAEAKKLFEIKLNQFQSNTKKFQQWEHIPEFVSKAGNNAIRIASIFDYYNSKEISENSLNNAFEIIEWYLNQASQYFYILSPKYQFQQDVYMLFDWIKARFANPTGKFKFRDNMNREQEIKLQPWQPFPKSDLLQFTQKKFRKAEYLNEVLEQLIGLDLIAEIQYPPSSKIYITIVVTEPTGQKYFLNPSQPHYKHIPHPDAFNKLIGAYDKNRMDWFKI